MAGNVVWPGGARLRRAKWRVRIVRFEYVLVVVVLFDHLQFQYTRITFQISPIYYNLTDCDSQNGWRGSIAIFADLQRQLSLRCLSLLRDPSYNRGSRCLQLQHMFEGQPSYSLVWRFADCYWITLSQKGYLWAFPASDQFVVEKGAGSLQSYEFGNKTMAHKVIIGIPQV